MNTSMYQSKAFKAYLCGFFLSLLLTLFAWFIVWRHVSSGHVVYSHLFIRISIVACAVIQMLIQFVFFLHLGREKKPRWNLHVLLAAIGVIIILVLGSIWIMDNLNYNMMNITPSQAHSAF